MLCWFQPSFQFVLNLRSCPENWIEVAELSGEVMLEERDFMRHANECCHTYYTILALIHKLQLAFHFGNYALAG
jgi:hypothetical protein